MDMFQYFLSHQSENTSAFSDIFRTAKEFHRLLGQKSYLLNHYLSMFFRLIVEMDFCALEDEIYQSISDLQKKIRNDLENHDNSIPIFDCQEPATEMELCWTALADSLLEQALKEFYHEYTHSYHLSVDLVDFRQTEEKLIEYLGKCVWEKFQQQLINCFLHYSLMQLFRQGIVIEITKRFLLRDLETDQEIFRLFLNHLSIEKSS
ncbi:hypothetical protein [Anaerotignum lactatifermentans]|uniref:hypothetical protein n=1 Tax=Anaerotignum lactatifermentans TaxID=160404 RepID=UPI002672CA20|nr:hypothetical protein [Anaerotignum lactatifermentans]